MTNQLNLFASVAQQEVIDQQKSYYKINSEQRFNRCKIIKSILDQNGFIEDVHYKFDAELYTKQVENARLSDKKGNVFTANYERIDVKGSVRLLTKYFYASKNTLNTDLSSVDVEDGKLQCGAITTQYRYYKPSTLLKKLKEYNEEQERKYTRFNSWMDRVNAYSYEMANKYPSADISIVTGSKRDYYGKYIDMRMVMVKFPSGSFIKFNIPEYDFQNITTAGIVDVQKESTDDMLDRFSRQAKES